ncbi:CopG family antitoxin [Jiella sp. M17.18]|uniref:CopG family antitoxin n=1 Tax=Jiella sp. M17.18 TaxID=3234247 RepID=UPI0034DEFFA2
MPALLTDEEAEDFVANADLTEYDLSGFRPMQFEFPRSDGRLNVRLPREQLEELKALAVRRGVPYTRLVRQFIEQGLQSSKG